MEYTDRELQSRIELYQKNIDYLKEQKSNISKIISEEKKRLDYWQEIKRSRQIKLF
jgi:hypothetical protein